MSQPQIKSRRQHIRLWFEFYKLALDDPALQANLAKVRTFYKPWGDPRRMDFREWWKDHSYLFGATQVEEVTKVSKAPNVLNLSIPLNLPVSQVLPKVKELVAERQRQRLHELGLDETAGKSLKAAFGTYEINAKELRGRPLGSQAATGYEGIHIALTRWSFSLRLVFAGKGRITGAQPRQVPSEYKFIYTPRRARSLKM